MDTKRYVLYAEDDVDDRELLEDAFRDFPGFQLKTFPNGRELLAFLKGSLQIDVCLILLDINMPVLTGVETLTALKGEPALCDLPVRLFSTAGSPTDRRIAEGLHTQIVLKPASYAGIRVTIEQLLKHCRKSETAT